jgi:outer membrane receptor protein involved in Fe transport
MVDLHGAVQLAHTRDSQYVPGDGEPLVRSGVLPEPRDNDLYLGSLVLRGPLAGGEILFSSNYVVQEVDGTQDASASAALFAASAPLRYLDDRVYRLFGNEVRVTSGPGAPITWLAGASQLVARSHTVGSLDPAPASGATVLDLSRHTSDLAVFGEAAMPLGPLRLTAGLRAARVSDEDEQRDAAGPERVASVVHTLTPSVSFDWHSPDHRRQAYLRLAQAVRPGGMNPDGDTDEPRFRSDELSSLDLGLRLMLAGDAVTLQPALFATRWRHVQSDYLLDNGLVGTHNVGDAHDVGLDTRLQVDAGAGWDIGVGALLQRARLDRAAAGAHDDLRLPIVPDFRTYLLVARDFTLGDWSTRLHARVDYSGSSRLSFEPELDRLMPHATTLAAGARLARNGFELQLTASNLLDSHADTFAFGNPFSIRATPQHTPRQPRTLTLQLARSW